MRDFFEGLFIGFFLSVIIVFSMSFVKGRGHTPDLVEEVAEYEYECGCEERIKSLESTVSGLIEINLIQDGINHGIIEYLEDHMRKVKPNLKFDPLLITSLINAIEQVETGGDMNAVGDNGKSIGSFQIGEMYWKDAVEFDKSLGGTYTDVAKDREYAVKVMLSFWARYADEWTPEELSRLHVGGPRGPQRASSLPYWNKVQKALND